MIRAVPVLMYHHVTPAMGLVTVTPQVFEWQMAYLARRNYRTLRADELLAFIQGDLILDRPSVFITFDDGYLDNYLYAYPILKRYQLTATIFGITGWLGSGTARPIDRGIDCPSHAVCMEAVGKGRHDTVMLRWSEVEHMVADGTVELHSHTHTHTRWDRSISDDAQRRDALRGDIEQSRAAIEQQLGTSTQHLCWPQGYYDTDYQSVARMAGFNALYTTAKGIVRKHADQWAIGRIVVKNRDDRWFAQRLWMFSQPEIGGLYARLRGT